MENIFDKTIKILNTDIGYSVDIRTMSVFLNQLSVMLSSGISIHSALDIIRGQKISKKLKKMIDRILIKIEEGISVSAAFADENFDSSRLLAAMIKAGENSGSLDSIMNIMSNYYKEKSENRRKIKGATLYPLILIFTSIIVISFLLTYVIPTFLTLFEGNGRDLPKPTRILIGISSFLHDYGIYLLFTIVGIIALFIIINKLSFSFRKNIDKIKIKIPIFSTYFKYIVLSKTALTFSILSYNGVPVLETLNIVKTGLGNEYLVEKYDGIIGDLILGKSLNQAFENANYFPPIFVSMLKVGEESGKLDKVMGKTAEYYDAELKYGISKFITIFEPILILIMALIVGFIVLSIAIPMFDLINYVEI
ncbi:MAG: type II secretion system F family protein [Tissierellia bacterium]|nr:type II secretion system F family protein [Tissierellia bacterium]